MAAPLVGPRRRPPRSEASGASTSPFPTHFGTWLPLASCAPPTPPRGDLPLSALSARPQPWPELSPSCFCGARGGVGARRAAAAPCCNASLTRPPSPHAVTAHAAAARAQRRLSLALPPGSEALRDAFEILSEQDGALARVRGVLARDSRDVSLLEEALAPPSSERE